MAVLRAFGVDIRSPDKADEALRSRRAELSRWRLPPVTVVWQADPRPVIRVRGPMTTARSWAKAVIELEDGGERPFSLETVPDHHGAPPLSPPDVDPDAAPCALPADLPPGYHRLRLDSPGATGDTLLLVAPERAYQPAAGTRGRQWGVFLPLYSMTTRRTWAAADYSDLDTAVEWVSGRGGSAFGTLPLLPAFLDRPFDPSPYSPVSRLFWNELYVDPRATPEFEACAEARTAFEATMRQAEELRQGRLVDYRGVWALKRRLFELLSACCRRNDSLAGRTDRFLGRNPVVGDYAAFRATCDRRGAPWPDWPGRQKGGRLGPRDYERADFDMYAFLQRAASEQLASVGRRKAEGGTGLYLDLPIGVSSDGFDAWANRHLFVLGACAGAPPDIFFSRGQNWGFAPLNPDQLRADRYRYWRMVLRHHMQFSSMLRVDHVMGLHRMFFIPRGMEANDGAYVRFPTEELYAVLTLESHRARTIVVGEDLGTVPRYVGPKMRRHGLRQMYAMYFRIDPTRETPVASPTRHLAAFVNTHDMATFSSFWTGKDVELRRNLGIVDRGQARAETREKLRIKRSVVAFLQGQGLLSDRGAEPEAVLRALLRYLAASPAAFLLINLEDLWLEESPQNVPGTVDEHPNWRQRARFPLEEWDAHPGVLGVLEEVARARSKRGE
jgi:4-alpha-glucanotransferase